MYVSKAIQTAPVNFPDFKGERHYMRKFTKKEGLPHDLKRWQDTVDAMLEGVDTDNFIYIMIDQGIVKANALHRRGGPHIDGYWNDGSHGGHGGISAHGGYPAPHHGGEPYRHCPVPARHNSHNKNHHASWSGATLKDKEAIILASNFPACRGWRGEFSGTLGEGGNCSAMDFSKLQAFDLEAGKTYIGNAAFVHESLPVSQDVERTLVRLNVKNWEPAFN